MEQKSVIKSDRTAGKNVCFQAPRGSIIEYILEEGLDDVYENYTFVFVF